MATVLSLLFLYPFIRHKKKESIFLLVYIFFLIIAKQIRLLLNEHGINTLGVHFFEYYAIIQYFMAIVALFLLEGKIRIFSILGFVLFSFYNAAIYIWWGKVGVAYYDYISLAVILLQVGLITYDQKMSLKVIFMMFITTIVATGQGRYI